MSSDKHPCATISDYREFLRIYLRDVLEFAKKRDKERPSALDLLARDVFEAGLYERNVFPKSGSDE